MIPIPVKPSAEYEQLQGRFGKAGLDFILNMAREINELKKRSEPTIIPVDNDYEISSSVNPPEVSHARSSLEK